ATRDTLPAMGQAIVTSNIRTELDRPVPDSVFSLTPGGADWELETQGEPFPFTLSGEHIYIDGRIAGREVTCLLDSGAGATVIDSALAEELGLEPVGEFAAQGVGGTSSFSFVELPEYRLGPAVIRGQKLAVMNLDQRFYPSTGMHIGMVVGYDLLSRFVTRIDYGEETIALYDPEVFEYEGDGRELPVEQSMSLLSFGAVLEDSIEVRLLLDTGAGGALHLTPSFFESNPGFLQDREFLESTVEGVGGEDTALVFRAGELELADYAVPAGLCSRFPGTAALDEYDGIAGNRILARFRLWLDYRRQRVILEPSELYDEGLPEDVTGFGVRIRGGRLVVNRVLEGSPADLAGMREDDVLVSVDGVPVGPSGLDTLNRLLPERPGREVDLLVRRSGMELELTLESAPLLPLD
ncbi:MAG: aspartyl protease family protein, partial [Candidatus Fermentibacterota bacterium]